MGADQVERRLTKTGESAMALERRLASSGKAGKLATLAMAGGALLVGTALQRTLAHATAYATGVRRIQAFIGGTAEESSKLAFVLGRLGISADTGTRAFGLLSRNLENNSANLAKYFTNAQLAHLRTVSLVQALPILAAKYQSLGTATEKTAFLMNVFGRGGAQIRRLLSLTADDYARLSAEAEHFGLVLTQKNIDAFKRFSDSERALGQSLQGLEVQLGAALLPAFESVTHAVTVAVTAFNSLPAPVRDTTAEIVVLGVALGALSKVAAFVGIEGAGTALLGFAGKAVQGAIASLGALDALTALEAEGATLAEIFGTLGVSAVGAFVGGLAAAGTVALGAGLGFRSLYGHLVANAVAANQLGDEAGHLIDQLFRFDGGSRAAAVGANSASHAFMDLEKSGKLTDDALGHITEHWQLVLQALRSGADVGSVIKELADNNVALAASIAGASSNASVNVQVQRDLQSTLNAASAAMKLQGQALAGLNRAVDQSGISSKRAADATKAYAEALLLAQGFRLDGTDDEKELKKAYDKTAAAAVDAAQKEADASARRAEQLREDQTRNAENVERSEERIVDARQRLVDAEENGARSIREADRAIVEAERNVAEAQQRSRDAQVALTDARKDAARTLEDLSFRVQENALSQERNRLRVVDAEKALKEARKSGAPEKVKNAELDLKEARLQQREQTVQAQRDQEELNKRRKDGIKGSKEVVAAEKALADANQGVIDAQRGASTAVENAARTRRQVSRDIAAATKGIADAQRDLARANRELAESIRELLAASAPAASVTATLASLAPFAFKFHEGGLVMHAGGPVTRMHEGGLRPDERHVIGQVGEFMLRRQAVRSLGADNLAYANRTGRFPGADPDALADAFVRALARAGFNRPNVAVSVPHQDSRVLARELAYMFGGGR